MKNWKEKIDFYLNSNESHIGRIIDLTLTLINLFACVLIVIESYSSKDWPLWLKIAEFAVIIIFSIEYVIRLISAKNTIKYIFSFYGIIDLLSIVPSIITIDGFKFLRALKVLRILRFLRMLDDNIFFFGVISKLQLQAVKTIFTVFTILFVFSAFIFFSESTSKNINIQIQTFGESFYYVVTTLSTVGFGDYVCISPIGKFFTVLMILSGGILVPWQAGKLVKMLINGDIEKNDIICPNCGLIGHDLDASHCKACGHVIFQKYDPEK